MLGPGDFGETGAPADARIVGMPTRLLDSLADDDRRTVLAAARRRRFTRGEVVFHDGDPGDTLHLIVKGHYAIRITTPLGDVATVRVLGPGEHFGELAVLEPGPRRGSVVSLEAGETMSLHRDDFALLRETMPVLDQVLTTALVLEVRRQASALVDALYVPVERRVWRRLAELVDLYGTDPPIVVPLTQDDLAQLAGTTRPTTNRVLRAGEEQGVVGLARGRIEVHDVAAVHRLGR
jgi:CRP-like cAMP-binding protein